jgi:hypothetical protein
MRHKGEGERKIRFGYVPTRLFLKRVKLILALAPHPFPLHWKQRLTKKNAKDGEEQ